MNRKFLRLALAGLTTLTALAAHAAGYPTQPVRIIVPFPAGASADNATRVVARKLGEYWGQQVLVENRAGVPAIQAGAAAPADGYTLLLGAGSQMVTGPLLRKLPYDPLRDFAPVGRVVTVVPVLTTHPSLNVKSVKELIALAKRKPGTLNFSSSGIGSPNQLAMELLMSMTGTDMVHVPYKGGAPSVVELVGGHVHLGINAIPSVLTHIKEGKLTALAVASSTRSRSLPDLPTIAEAGVPGFEYTIWYGLYAPAKTPGAIVAKLSADLQRALAEPEVIKLLQQQGTEPAPAASQELARFMKDDSAMWSKLVAERKLQLKE